MEELTRYTHCRQGASHNALTPKCRKSLYGACAGVRPRESCRPQTPSRSAAGRTSDPPLRHPTQPRHRNASITINIASTAARKTSPPGEPSVCRHTNPRPSGSPLPRSAALRENRVNHRPRSESPRRQSPRRHSPCRPHGLQSVAQAFVPVRIRRSVGCGFSHANRRTRPPAQAQYRISRASPASMLRAARPPNAAKHLPGQPLTFVSSPRRVTR
jgi:hypothetical protein